MKSLCWILPDIGHYHHARASAFARLGKAHMNVLCLGGRSGFDEFAFRNRDNPGYKLVTAFPQKFYRQISAVDVFRTVSRWLDKIRPNAVCVQGWSEPHALAPLFWCGVTQTPAIVTSETHFADFRRRPWKERIKRIIVRRFAAGLVGGRPHADYLAALGMPSERIFFGYDVVDNEHFAAGAEAARRDAAASRARLGLPDRYFLASARFVEKKNLIGLLRAYSRYKSKVGKDYWKLVLLGNGRLHRRILHVREQLSLIEDVMLPGFKAYDELPAYYGLAGAFVHASITEQWGLVVNEAMAAGLPVIVSNRCGCALDLVSEESNGFTFDPCNADELAARMCLVASGGLDIESMGAASRNIISRWTPATFAANLARAVEAACSEPAKQLGFMDSLLIWGLLRR